MKNLRKFNESKPITPSPHQMEMPFDSLYEKYKKILKIVEDFNENFLELSDEGFIWEGYFYDERNFESGLFNSENRRNLDNIEKFHHTLHKILGIRFYIKTKCEYERISETWGESSYGLPIDIFNDNLNNIKKTIDGYKNIIEIVSDNIERFSGYYKHQLDSKLNISRYTNNSGNTIVTFNIKVKI